MTEADLSVLVEEATPPLFKLQASSRGGDYIIKREGDGHVAGLIFLIMGSDGDTIYYRKPGMEHESYYSTHDVLGVVNISFAPERESCYLIYKPRSPPVERMIPSENHLQRISQRTGIPLAELQGVYEVKRVHAQQIAKYICSRN